MNPFAKTTAAAALAATTLATGALAADMPSKYMAEINNRNHCAAVNLQTGESIDMSHLLSKTGSPHQECEAITYKFEQTTASVDLTEGDSYIMTKLPEGPTLY